MCNHVVSFVQNIPSPRRDVPESPYVQFVGQTYHGPSTLYYMMGKQMGPPPILGPIDAENIKDGYFHLSKPETCTELRFIPGGDSHEIETQDVFSFLKDPDAQSALFAQTAANALKNDEDETDNP
jgi:hypothetical protein